MGWHTISSGILRYRIPVLIAVAAITVAMGFLAGNVEMSYKSAQVLPESDPAFKSYQTFKSIFGEEANIIVIGIKDSAFFNPRHLKNWRNLEQSIAKLDSIEWTVSVATAPQLIKKVEKKAFALQSMRKLKADSLKRIVENTPFYNQLLYNAQNNTYLMYVAIAPTVVHSKKRLQVVSSVEKVIKAFEQSSKLDIHVSGLPFVRTDIVKRSSKEIFLFIILAIGITGMILFLFFKAVRNIYIPIGAVLIGVVWSAGILGILEYKITSLTGLIPPLLIVIGIPNAIFMINKYQQEYLIHKNKIKALRRVIQNTGLSIFMTNLTTAIGFATLIVTGSKVLVEFGIVASLSVLCLFLISITITPIIFSYFPPPKPRHVRHLQNKRTKMFLHFLTLLIRKYRIGIFIFFGVLCIIASIGTTFLDTSGKVADELPKDTQTYRDLMFFEHNFAGVMPFEILVDTKAKNGAFKQDQIWEKVDALQDSLLTYNAVSQPVSIVGLIKYANQTYYNGLVSQYRVPNQFDRLTILRWIGNSQLQQSSSFLSGYLDSSKRFIRIRAQIADIGTKKMQALTDSVRQDVKGIFNKNKSDVMLTGASLLIAKGTSYLLKNLIGSLLIAIFIISCLMAFMFRSFKMVIISLIPNLVPLLVTAGAMGIFGIPLKASTCIIFTVAFGISVDDTIHLLTKYKQSLKKHYGLRKVSVYDAVRDTAISMAYTSIVLFFGFSIFIISDFGSTVAFGALISMILVIAMFTNLSLLPGLLLALQKKEIDKEYNRKMPIDVYHSEAVQENGLETDDLAKLQTKNAK